MTKDWAVEYWDGSAWGLLARDPWTGRRLTEKQATAEAADIRARGVEARAVRVHWQIIRQWTGLEWIAVVNHPWDSSKFPPYDASEIPTTGDLRAFEA